MSAASSARVRTAAEWSLCFVAVIGAIATTMKAGSQFDVKLPIFLPRLVLAPLYIVFVVYGCSDHQKINALSFVCVEPITPTHTHLPRPRAPLTARSACRQLFRRAIVYRGSVVQCAARVRRRL